jgi:hypothetical protein
MYQPLSHPTTFGRVLGAAIFLLLVAPTARATIIDFEDIAVSPGANDIGGDRISRGFLLDSPLNHSHLLNATFGIDSGSTYLAIDDTPNRNSVTLSPVGGGLFAISQVDLGEFAGAILQAHTVTVTGNLFGGGTIATTFTLDQVWDGTGGAADFQTFTFDSSWANLQSATLQGAGANFSGLNNSNGFAIDNIVVTVPEPAGFAFIATPFLVACFRHRRPRR